MSLAPARQAGPASPLALLVAFNRLALQGFGGVLAVAQVELVERRGWLSKAEFLELLSVAQVLPGPNIVNLALIFGDRCFGLRGAAAAAFGLMALPLVIVLGLAALYGEFASRPMVSGALRGMGIVAAGLVIATALKLLSPLKTHPLGQPLCLGFAALTIALVAGWRWPLGWVVLLVGGAAIACAWRALRP
jgi:chromate transporter